MRRYLKPDKSRLQTHQVAYRIYQDILFSLERYTDDSFAASFFLPEEITEHCQSVAASFALILYSPRPLLTTIYNSRLYYLYYLSMVYGAQIYLKEYSYHHNHAPLTLVSSSTDIEVIKHKVTTLLGENIAISPEAQLVMDLYEQQLYQTKNPDSLTLEGAAFAENDFDRCLKGTLLWGYLFAKEMIVNNY